MKKYYLILIFVCVVFSVFAGENSSKLIEQNKKKAKEYNDSGLRRGCKFKDAIKDFDKAIELNPKYVEAYVNRGVEKFYDDLPEAIKDFDKAIELDPKCVKAYINRGKAQLESWSYKKAINDFDKAIELDPKNSEAYCHRGTAKMLLAMWEQSERDKPIAIDYTETMKDYNKAIELDSKNVLAYAFRGRLNLSLNQYKAARADLLKAKKLFTKDGSALPKSIEISLQELNEAEKKAKK